MSQIEVYGTLGIEESNQTEKTDLPETPSLARSSVQTYTGRLLQTNDTVNTNLVFMGIVLCLIAYAIYKIRKLEAAGE